MLAAHPGALWGELSYRGGITDGSGRLTPAWQELFAKYPDRFLLGSDTWINEAGSATTPSSRKIAGLPNFRPPPPG